MNIETSEENIKYAKAEKRVKEIKGFYTHVLTYIILVPLWIFINYKTYWGFQWFWFPVVGVGISVIIHAFVVFGYGKNWEERKMKELMKQDAF